MRAWNRNVLLLQSFWIRHLPFHKPYSPFSVQIAPEVKKMAVIDRSSFASMLSYAVVNVIPIIEGSHFHGSKGSLNIISNPSIQSKRVESTSYLIQAPEYLSPKRW